MRKVFVMRAGTGSRLYIRNLIIFLLFLAVTVGMSAEGPVYASRLIYTIQTGSFFRTPDAQKQFDSIVQKFNENELDNLRIEKIGNFYSVRLGTFKSYSTAVTFLKALKPEISKATVIEAYIKDERIIKLYKSLPVNNKQTGKEKSYSIPIPERIKPRVTKKSDKNENHISIRERTEIITDPQQKKDVNSPSELTNSETAAQRENPAPQDLIESPSLSSNEKRFEYGSLPKAGENITVMESTSVVTEKGDTERALASDTKSQLPHSKRSFIKKNSIIIISIVFSLIIAFALLGVIVYRRIRSQQALKAGLVVGKYKELVNHIADSSTESVEDFINELSTIGNVVFIEMIIDKAASSSGRPINNFQTLYDATGITDRYLTILKESKSWKKRAFASEKLGHIGSVKAVPHLLSIIQDINNEDEDVRTTALRALGRIKDKEALPFLIEALGCPETWLPPRIAEIIVNIGKEAIKPLKKELRKFESESRRGWAAEILGWLDAENAAITLIESLFDVSPEVRAKAAGALGKIKDDRSIAKLSELLVSEPVPFVRTRVSQALGAMGHPGVIHYLVNILKDPEWWVRVRAVEALEQLGELSIPSLLVAMEDEDEEVRRRAALALERIGYVEKILEEYREKEYKPEIRKILLHVAEAGVIESFSEKLSNSNIHLKKRIVRILGEARTREASEPLIELLEQTSDWTLKARVIQSIGKIGVKEAVPLLIENLKHSEYWVRQAAVEAIGMLDAGEFSNDVAEILKDPNPHAREAALTALSMLKVTTHWDKIEMLLHDPSVKVRCNALRVIREMGITTDSRRILEIMSESTDEVKVEGVKYFHAIRDSNVHMDIIRLIPYGSAVLQQIIVEYVRQVTPDSFQSVIELFNIRTLSKEAIATLIEIGSAIKDEDAYRFILEFTSSVDEYIREKAFRGMACFGFSNNESIFEKALFDPSKSVRTIVLASIGPASQDTFLKKAKALEKDPDEDVRFALVLAIGASGANYLRPIIVKMLDDPSTRVVGGALISLASLNDPEFLEFFYARRNIKEIRDEIKVISADERFIDIIENIRAKAEDSMNLEVALVFAKDDIQFAVELINKLKETLDPVIRLKTIEVLKIIAKPEFFTSILGIMKKDPYGEIRIEAMNLITTLGRPDEVITALAEMLMDPAPDVRIRAANLLSRYRHPKALEALLHVLDTMERDFREAVTSSLSELLSGEPEKVAELVKKVPETKTRKIGLAWFMGKSRTQESTILLLELLNDEDAEVRAAAVGALAKFKKTHLIDNMEHLIYDPNERVRAAAVNAIAAIGGEKAFEIVSTALQDIDEFVRVRAVVGLAKSNLEKTIHILRTKAAKFPEFESCLNGLLYIAGTSNTYDSKMDSIMISIVEELCSKKEMMHVFSKSPDRAKRLQAFRILAFFNQGNPDLLDAALKDADPEIRGEAKRLCTV